MKIARFNCLIIIVLATIAMSLLITVGTAYGFNKNGEIYYAMDFEPYNFSSVNNSDAIINYGNVTNFYDFNPEDMVTAIVTINGTGIIDMYENNSIGSISDYLLSEEGAFVKYSITQKQNEVIDAIENTGIQITIKHRFSLFLNGFAINVPYKYIKMLRTIDNIVSVDIAEAYNTPNITDIEDSLIKSTGIFVNNSKYQGEGMLVAVLDTGLDIAHSCFKSELETIALSKAQLGEIKNNFEVDPLYVNSKIPFAYDYADLDANVTSPLDHGTHVSGIIAGNDDVIQGVVKNAQIAMFKVFSDMGSAYTTDILKALEDAVILGVDAINMSLGSPVGFATERDSTSDWINKAYNKVEQLGIELFVASGNSYYRGINGTYNDNPTYAPDYGVSSSPASYDAAVCVASIDAYGVEYLLANNETKLYFNDAINENQKKYDFSNTIRNGHESVTYEYVYIENLGQEQDYVGKNVKGKIVLVQRGVTSFEEKQKIAYNHGAIGCIVFNNDVGMINMSIPNLIIPCASISRSDGEILAAKGYGTIQISEKLISDPYMSEFSSWGPLSDLTMKPEITGPGGSIKSCVNGGYQVYSGTSMATPNVVGAAIALKQALKERYSELNNTQLMSLVYKIAMSSATIVNDKYSVPYSVRKQGAGEFNLENALNTKAYLSVTGLNKSKIELGDDPEKSGIYILNFNLTNMSNEILSYDISTNIMTEKINENGTLLSRYMYLFDDVSTNVYVNGIESSKTITIDGNSEIAITLEVILGDESKNYIDKYYEYGMYVEGFALLTSNDGESNLNIPFLSFYGDWSSIPMFDSSIYDNEEEVMFDTAVITLENNNLIAAGSYIYYTDENIEVPDVTFDNIAFSDKDNANYMLFSVYMGLLQNSSKVTYTITDAYTGQEIFSMSDLNVGKSYFNTDNMNLIPSSTYIGFSPRDYSIANNQSMLMTITAESDYYTHKKHTFTFPMYYDTENPTLMSSVVRYEGEKAFIDLEVYDNHYLMAISLFDSVNGIAGNRLTNYPIPVYNFEKGKSNIISIDITDCLDKLTGKEIIVTLEDYARNVYSYTMNADLNNASKFKVSQGVLIEYMGTDSIVKIPFGIKEIANSVFENNSIITSVSIPEGVKKIGEYAFKNCTNLKTIALPSSIKIIGTQAFANCSALKNLTLKATNIPIFGTDVFLNISNFKLSVPTESLENYKTALPIYADSIVGIAEIASADDFEIENGVLTSYIGKGEYVVIPDDLSITEIGNFAFKDSKKLTGVEIPEGVINIGSGAFFGCENLRNVILPSTLAKIGFQAFINCTSLTDVMFNSITPPKMVSKSMTWTITPYLQFLVPDESLEAYQTAWKEFLKYIYAQSDKIADFIIEDGVLKQYNGKGGSIIIPEGVIEISDNVFNGNDRITAVQFPSTIKKIGNKAFYATKNLTDIILPESIESVGSSAFASSGLVMAMIDFGSNCSFTFDIFINCGNLIAIYCSDENYDYIKEKLEIFSSKIYNMGMFTINNNTIVGYDADLLEIALPSGFIGIGDAVFKGSKLASVYIPDGYQTIGNEAFFGCNGLINITIPESVTYIGDNAFSDCLSLKNMILKAAEPAQIGEKILNINDSVKIFVPIGSLDKYKNAWSEYKSILYDMTSYAEDYIIENGVLVKYNGIGGDIYIPEGVKEIAEKVFMGNLSITSVTLPEGLEMIGYMAFKDCDTITKIHLPTTLKDMAEYAFDMCTHVEEMNLQDTQLTIIKYHSMYGMAKLKECILPDTMEILQSHSMTNMVGCKKLVLSNNLRVIEWNALMYCGEEELVLPHSLVEFGPYALYRNDKLKTIIIPSSVQVIDTLVFGDCKALKTVVFEENVSIVGQQMFAGCENLESVTLCKSISLIGTSAFSGCVKLTSLDFSMTCVKIIKFDAFRNCEQLNEILLPDSLMEIQESAFAGCTALRSIVLPSSITILKKDIFNGCSSLKNINISETQLEELGENAFFGCIALNKLTLPSTVKSIGISAFSGSGINALIMQGKTPPTIGTTAFANVDNYIIYVPAFTRPNYLGVSNWMEYKEHIYDLADVFELNGTTVIGYNGNEKELIIPGDMTGIGSNAFNGKLIETIVVLEGVKTIEDNAFASIPTLKSITLPSSIESIGSNAFANCPLLEKITLSSMTPMTIKEDTFKDYNGRIEIPEGALNAYLENQIWANVTNILELSFIVKNGVLTEYLGNGGVITIPDTVKEIGQGVFESNKKITEVTIPSSVVSIGFNAFKNCSNLIKVIMADSVIDIGESTFEGCKSLKEIKMSNGIVKIPSKCFNGCSSLESFEILPSVKYIGKYCFQNSGLKIIDIPETVTDLAYYAFYGCYSAEKLIMRADSELIHCTFANCTGLKTVEFYGNIEEIQGWDFGSSTLLESIKFYGDIGTIGCYMEELGDALLNENKFSMIFALCTNLKSVEFFGNVGTIGGFAFNSCPSLTDVIFHKNLGLIDGFAFNGCENLKTWTVSEDNEYLYLNIDGVMFNKNMTRVYRQPNNLKIASGKLILPETIKTIDPYAFSHADYYLAVFDLTFDGWSARAFKDFPSYNAFESITLGTNIQAIGNYAFMNQIGLNSIDTVGEYNNGDFLEIGNYAFYGCVELVKITLPQNTRTIKDFAFAECSKLTSINIPDYTEDFNFPVVFLGCRISEIIIDNNMDLIYENGVLMSGDGRTIHFYSPYNTAESYIIPEGVEKISANAFANNRYLKEVTLPTSLKIIGDKAFFGTSELVTYKFLGKEAPILEAMPNKDYTYAYANFMMYMEDLTTSLTIYYPQGAQYNNYIWITYFRNHYEVSESGDSINVDSVNSVIAMITKAILSNNDYDISTAIISYNKLNAVEKSQVMNYGSLVISDTMESETNSQNNNSKNIYTNTISKSNGIINYGILAFMVISIIVYIVVRKKQCYNDRF